LYIGCIGLVLGFRTSSHLAAAYGLAEAGVMLVTSLSMIGVAAYVWQWPLWKSLLAFIPLAIIDTTFLSANSLKLLSGGYVPLLVGVSIYILMRSWLWGRQKIDSLYRTHTSLTIEDLIKIKKKATDCLPKSFVMITPFSQHKLTGTIPVIEQVFWDRYGMLPKHIIFLTISPARVPHVHDDRFKVTTFYKNADKGSISSVTVYFGFMEEPNVDKILEDLAEHDQIHIEESPKEWLLHVIQEKVVKSRSLSLKEKIKYAIYELLSNVSTTPDQFWGLGDQSRLSVERVAIRLKS
jgi:KUP system potassium uptake protein